ncbi:MAG: hypothetical protein WC796_05450 [Candidatus Pacearchaeota archaeon]|jgi:hypothetical protein
MDSVLKQKSFEKSTVRVLIFLLSLGVITMLLISAPANAFTIGFSSDKKEVEQGDEVSFDISLQVSQEEYSSISSITLSLDGPENKYCTFSTSGNILSGCAGVKNIIVNMNNNSDGGDGYSYGYAGYMYNYAYGYGDQKIELNYRLVYDTETFPIGTYTTSVKVNYGSSQLQIDGENLIVKQKSESSTSSHASFGRKVLVYPGQKAHLQVREGDVFNLLSDSDLHELIVKRINTDSVDIELHSEFQELNLKVGDVKTVDLNGDGQNDLSISLWYLGDKKATLYVEAYHASILKKEAKIMPQIIKTDSIPQFSGPDYQSSNWRVWFGNFGLIIMFIILDLIMIELVLILYVLKKKRKLNRRQMLKKR